MPNGRKYWAFTWNNPPHDIDVAINDLWERDLFEYLVYQHEIGEENGTPHLQGYCILKKRKAKPSLLFGGGHFAPAIGTPQQNRTYCTKEDTRDPDYSPKEFGEVPETTQGTRSDLLAVKEKVDQGIPMLEIWDEHFGTMARSYKAIQEYKRLKTPARDFVTEVIVIIGPTGTGKSRYARGLDDKAYYKQNSVWWDGYDGQETVVLDDFYGWIPYCEMLRLMDRYPHMIQTKGGQTHFLAKRMVITSNTAPARWYPKVFLDQRYSLAAFSRRITSWIFMGSRGSFSASSAEEFDEKSEVLVSQLE